VFSSIYDNERPALLVVKDAQRMKMSPQISSFAPSEGPVEGGSLILVGTVGGDFTTDFTCSIQHPNIPSLPLIARSVSLDDWLAQSDGLYDVLTAMASVSDSLAAEYLAVTQSLIDSKAVLSSPEFSSVTYSLLVIEVSDLRKVGSFIYPSTAALIMCNSSSWTTAFNFSVIRTIGLANIESILTDYSGAKSPLQGGSRLTCTLSNFAISYSTDDIQVHFGTIRATVIRVVESDSSRTTIWVSIPPALKAEQLQVYVSSVKNNYSTGNFSFTYFDESRVPVVRSYSPYQVYSSGGQDVAVCLSNLILDASEPIFAILSSFSEQVQIKAAVTSRSGGNICTSFVCPALSPGTIFVTIQGGGMSSSVFQLLYVAEPFGPPIVTLISPSRIDDCSHGQSVQVKLENFKQLSDASSIQVAIGPQRNMSNDGTVLSTFSSTLVTFWLEKRDSGTFDISIWAHGRESQQGNFSLFCPILQPNIVSWSPTYAFQHETVNLRIWIENLEPSKQVYVQGNMIATLIYMGYGGQPGSTFAYLDISVTCHQAGPAEFNITLSDSQNLHATFDCIGLNTPVIFDSYPTKSFVYGGFPITFTSETYSYNAEAVVVEFHQKDRNISIEQPHVTIANTEGRIVLTITCFVPPSNSHGLAAISLHFGNTTVRVPSGLEYLNPVSPTISRISTTVVPISSATTMLVALKSFPRAIDPLNSAIAAEFEWPGGLIIPALCSVSKATVSAYLGSASVQDLTVEVSTPTGTGLPESSSVVLRLYDRSALEVNAEYFGISFFNPSNPRVIQISVQNGASGSDSVFLPTSKNSIVTLVISNAPSAAKAVIKVDTLNFEILFSGQSTDSNGISQLTMNAVIYPSGPVQSRYGFVAFATPPSSCVATCCSTMTCTQLCFQKVACFELRLFDDSGPSISAFYSSLRGTSSGRDTISLRVSKFPELANAGNVICSFGSMERLGTVNIPYSGPEFTDIVVITPPYALPDLSPASVTVTVTTISRPDLSVSFQYEYLPAAPNLVSMRPTNGPCVGGQRVSLSLSDFPYDRSSTVLLFGQTAIPGSNLSISYSIDGKVTIISFVTLPSSPGYTPISVFPTMCPLPCKTAVRTQVYQTPTLFATLVPPVVTNSPYQTREISVYLSIQDAALDQDLRSIQIFSTFQVDKGAFSSPDQCSLQMVNSWVKGSISVPAVISGKCDATVTLNVMQKQISVQNISFHVQFFDRTAIRINSVAPSFLLSSIFVANRYIRFQSSIVISIANVPQSAQLNDTSIIYGSGVNGRISSVKTNCDVTSTAECNSFLLTAVTPSYDQPGMRSVMIQIAGQVLIFDLNYSAPCDFDSFCASQRLYPDILAIQANAPQACLPKYCFSLDLIPDPVVVSVTPTKGDQRGGSVIEVLCSNFPASSVGDITIQIGDGASKLFIPATYLIQEAGYTSQQGKARIRFRTPAVPLSVNAINIRISVPLFSTTRTATFRFLYLPYITGKVQVSDYQPREIDAGADFKLLLSLTNVRMIPLPFSTSEVRILFRNISISPSAILFSDTSTTVVSVSLKASAASEESLLFSVFDTERGMQSASDVFRVKVKALFPMIKNIYPASVPSYDSGAQVRVTLENVGGDAVESVRGLALNQEIPAIPINVISSTVLDFKTTAFLLSLPSLAPGLILIDFKNGNNIITNFSFLIYDRDIPSVELVSPTSIYAGNSPQLLSIYLKNFPTSTCGSTGRCFEQALNLLVVCKGKQGRINSHSEPSGLLKLEVVPPAFREAGQVQCTVSTSMATGKKLAASFPLNYQAVTSLIPIDASKAGGSLISIIVLGFGAAAASDPSQVSVSICGEQATSSKLIYNAETTTIAMEVYAPARSIAGTCQGSITIAGSALKPSFLLSYYDAPVGLAVPATAAQDGSTADGGSSVDILLTHFPSIESAQDISVAFGSQICDGVVCSIEKVVNYASLAVVTVKIPVCIGHSAVDLTVAYCGKEAVPEGLDTLGNYTFTTKVATMPFTYYQPPLRVISVMYCAVCNLGYCMLNGLCKDFNQPQFDIAPAGGSGRLTLYLDGAYGHGGVQRSPPLSTWSFTVAFGDTPAMAAITAYGVSGSLIAVECQLPVDEQIGDVEATVSVLPAGSQVVRSARFTITLMNPNLNILCLSVSDFNTSGACAGAASGAQLPVKLHVTNLPFRPGSSLSEASDDLQVVFNGITLATGSVTAIDGPSAIIEFVTQSIAGPSRTFVFSVGLKSQPSALAVGSFSVVTPPVVKSASFNAMLTSTLISFDSPTSQCTICGNNCSCIFQSSSAALFSGIGSQASCVWNNDGSLTVMLAAGATVVPGSVLAFNPCLTGADGRALSLPLTTVVSAPSVPTAPTISLNGPSTVDPCSALELVATSYSPRDLVYVWSCTNDAAVDGTLKLVSGNTVTFAAGTSELPLAGKTYDIRVRAVDFVGTSSAWAMLSVFKSPRAAPQIQFSTPVVEVLQGVDVILEGQAVFSLCPTPLTQLIFSWSQTGGPPLSPSAGLAGSTLPQVLIPGSAMVGGGRYRFALQVSSTVDPSSVSVGSCIVSVQRLPLVAVIAGGTALQRSAASTLFLDASGSYDPSWPGDSDPTLSFSWTCSVSGGKRSSQCRTVNGTLLVLSSSSSQVCTNVYMLPDYVFMLALKTIVFLETQITKP
jgi:hypothetical protein